MSARRSLEFRPGLRPKGESGIIFNFGGIHLIHIERRIGHDEIAFAQEFVAVHIEGIAFCNLPLLRPCTARFILANLIVVSVFLLPTKRYGPMRTFPDVRSQESDWSARTCRRSRRRGQRHTRGPVRMTFTIN